MACPGLVIWITPAQVHMSFELLSSAGISAISTFGLPGVQGAGVTGTQGAGVNTPEAAEVAAMTAGLVGAEHMPNGGMFTVGWLSMMFAAGVPVSVRFCGSTIKDEGAAPKLHCIVAPIQTCIGIIASFARRRTLVDLH